MLFGIKNCSDLSFIIPLSAIYASNFSVWKNNEALKTCLLYVDYKDFGGKGSLCTFSV